MATGVMRSQAGIQQHLSDYRVVLLGHRGSGKTSVGNSILDADTDGSGVTGTGTLRSVLRQGEAAGRSVTLVEAPGWWKNYLVKDTAEVTRREIASSVTLCPPGPHAFALVVRLNSPFTEKHRRAVEEHVELLGERAWRHTIVLFTYNERLEFDIMERQMGSDREARHRWLVERCRNRCHVFNVDKKGDSSPQIAELLEKIDEVVAGNNGRHYEPERKPWWEPSEGGTITAVRERKSTTPGQEEQQDIRPGWKPPLISKLRILLLGYRRSGKSSAGNLVLGQRCFEPGRRTTQSVCKRVQAEQQRQQVTVVDTPGWWRAVSVSDTPELTKQEVVLGACLCPPGPHALLLVHRVDFSFGEDELRAVEEHLMLLGEDAWAHAMVLFTFGDWLGAVGIEQYIQAEGKALQRLLERCGHRYHILSQEGLGSGSQVPDLLQKIEAMAGEKGSHFELDRKTVKSLKKRKLAVMKRAARRAKQQRQRESVKFLKGNSYLLATLRIVLLGYIQSGKSSVGNTILGPEVFDVKPTALCEWHHRSVAGQRLTVVDTPGWQKSTPAAGTPARAKEEMVLAASLCHPGPHAVLLVVRADASFGAEEGLAVREHLELLGERVWRHTLVLFTCGDGLGLGHGHASVEQYIESEGEALREVVEKCGNRYHVFTNKATRKSDAQVLELLEKVKGMVAVNSGHHLETGSLWSDEREDGRGAEADADRERREETRDGNWMRLDVSEEPRCLAEGRLHRFSRNIGYSYVHTQEDVETAQTIWPDGFRKMGDEGQSDDVFLEASPARKDVPHFSLYGPLTPIPSAEHSLASSSTSITKLV